MLKPFGSARVQDLGIMLKTSRSDRESENIDMRIIATFALLTALTVITACNTVAGAGKDVSSAGHAVTKAAQ